MDTFIFLVGVFVSVVVALGLLLTVREFRRFEREGTRVDPRCPL